MKNRKKVHVVPHTHWDREWYFTLEDSSVLLIEHMEFLVETLNQNENFKYFVLDGQMAMIDDLFILKPAIKEKFTKLVNEGRIVVGPMYSQCDTQVIKLESFIRNVEFGLAEAKKFDKYMKIGYLPDCFGQNAYLPSIFKQSGLDYSIFQRGVLNEQVESSLNFNWVSPNGESIKTTNIFNGYGVGKFIRAEEDYVFDYLMPVLDGKKDPELLLPAGGDQYPVQTSFISTCEDMNNMQDQYEFVLSSYEKYMDTIEPDFEIHGELISCQKSRIHRTMHSQRLDVKMLNSRIEKKMIEQFEPLIAIYKMMGGTLEDEVYNDIWKKLLVIHGHDGICSCNSDATNEDVKARLFALDRFIDAKMNVIKKKIAVSKNLDDKKLLLFSYGPNSKINGEVRIITRKEFFKITSGNADVKFFTVNQKYVDGGHKVVLTKAGEEKVALPGYFETTIQFDNLFLELGVHEFDILEEDNNSFVRKESKNIRDFVKDNKIYMNGAQLGFEVCTDDGDSYDFAFVEGETPLEFYEIENVSIKDNKLFFETKIHNHEGIHNTVESVITLDTDVKVVHKLKNNMENTRIRQIIKSDGLDDYSYADVGFGKYQRVNHNAHEMELWNKGEMCELPLEIYPHERGIICGDVTVTNATNKEYQVDRDKLYLTILRSVGYLGKDDLTTRPGRASGINNVMVETPAAQMIGVDFECEFVLTSRDLYESYFENTTNYDFYQLQSMDLFSNRIDRFVMPSLGEQLKQVEAKIPQGSYLSSLYVKEGHVVARLFNPTSEEQNLKCNGKMKKCNIDLSDVQSVEALTIAPNDYATLIIE